MSDRIAAYAAAVVQIARAEGAVDTVLDELGQIASALDSNAQLRDALTDSSSPVGRRLTFLETEVLGAASTATRGAVAMLLAAGAADDLAEIATEVARAAAAESGRELAEVRVAVALDEQRREQLRSALEAATGKQLDLQVVVDPDVVGGVRAIIGDTIIDGSLSRRLDDIRTRVGA